MTRRPLVLVFAAAGAVLIGACGGGGHEGHTSTGASGGATRTVRIDMVDIAFSPKDVDVKADETVRFVFTNKGNLKHDAFLGDEAAQQAHEHDMHHDGEMHHGGGDQPGRQGIRSITRIGNFEAGQDVQPVARRTRERDVRGKSGHHGDQHCQSSDIGE